MRRSTNNLLGFSAEPTTGALTPLPGVTINPGNVPSTGFPTGTNPSGIIEDHASTHLYVTDQTAKPLLLTRSTQQRHPDSEGHSDRHRRGSEGNERST